MFRSLCLPLLGLALLAQTAVAQQAPTKKPTRTANYTPRPATGASTKAAARRADPLNGTNDNGADQSGYAAPGEPIQMPNTSGKNTATYDGQPAAKPKSNTTLATPK